MRQSNMAMLSKLGWCLINFGDSLWSNMVKGKYFGNRSGLEVFSHKHASSYTWKSIIYRLISLRKGVDRMLGIGRM